MKLLIVTIIDELHEELLKLFKLSKIKNFSGSDIEGYRQTASRLRAASWFPGQKEETDSHLYFSFTKDENIDVFFKLVEGFNNSLETNSPIKAVVVPIERFV